MRISQLTRSDWNDHLPETGFGVFHTAEGLSVLERHSPYDLLLFGGFKGDQVVALLPLFHRTGPFGTTAVASPPPGMGVPSLGPLVFESSPKQRKREKVNDEFTSKVIDTFDLNARSLFFLLCCPEYDDPRPYQWNGLSIEPAFTYRINVDGRDPEQLLQSFSRSRRREIRDAEDADLTVERGGLEACRQVFESARERYAEQDEPFWGEWSYVRDLFESLGDRAQVYCLRDESDNLLGGIVVLFSNDTAFFWLGGSKNSNQNGDGNVNVNTLLHWKIIEEIATEPPIPTVSAYDLVGAATQRLSQYKAKFGPDLTPYYKVTSDPLKMRFAGAAYELTS